MFVHVNTSHLAISDADSIHAKHFLPAIQCVIPEPFWAFDSSVVTTFQSNLLCTTSCTYLWTNLLIKRFPKTLFPFTRQGCFMGTDKRTSLRQKTSIILIKLCLWTHADNTTHLRPTLWWRICYIGWNFLLICRNGILINCRLLTCLITRTRYHPVCVCATLWNCSTCIGDVCSLALQRKGLTTTLALSFCTA